MKDRENQRFKLEQLLAEAESAQIRQLHAEDKIQKLQHFVQVKSLVFDKQNVVLHSDAETD